jgi:hypothetical protein
MSTHEPWVLWLIMVVLVRLRCGGRPLPGRPAGDLDAGHRPRPWSGWGATTAVQRDELALLDDGLADGALLGVRVDVEPLVEAGPAEEVAAEGDHGVLRQVEADVALEAPRVLAAAAVGPRQRLASAARHAAWLRSAGWGRSLTQGTIQTTRAREKKGQESPTPQTKFLQFSNPNIGGNRFRSDSSCLSTPEKN